ncbi:hypothetical protein RB195_004491 [Necator americanus]|uniref:Uncharacterized protein n=1 Tax=Necator americanus TaxID=51031 RepID=A0ABR1BI99_NECAM
MLTCTVAVASGFAVYYYCNETGTDTVDDGTQYGVNTESIQADWMDSISKGSKSEKRGSVMAAPKKSRKGTGEQQQGSTKGGLGGFIGELLQGIGEMLQGAGRQRQSTANTGWVKVTGAQQQDQSSINREWIKRAGEQQQDQSSINREWIKRAGEQQQDQSSINREWMKRVGEQQQDQKSTNKGAQQQGQSSINREWMKRVGEQQQDQSSTNREWMKRVGEQQQDQKSTNREWMKPVGGQQQGQKSTNKDSNVRSGNLTTSGTRVETIKTGNNSGKTNTVTVKKESYTRKVKQSTTTSDPERLKNVPALSDARLLAPIENPQVHKIDEPADSLSKVDNNYVLSQQKNETMSKETREVVEPSKQ